MVSSGEQAPPVGEGRRLVIRAEAVAGAVIEGDRDGLANPGLARIEAAAGEQREGGKDREEGRAHLC